MGSSNFFALLDDIANVLDDVATLTKVATQKTSGVLGDDLALNANQVSGATPDRELPIVWAVAKGSAKNKAILVPLALLISALLPVLITPFLVVGGLYLCFEGCEKVIHTLFPLREIKQHYREHLEHLQLSDSDLVTIERDKIKGRCPRNR